MATIMDLYVNLIGNDASLLLAAKRSASALNGVAATSMGVGDKMDKMKKASALALSAIVGYSVDKAAKFQQEMELLATQAQVPQAAIKGLSDQVLKMAGAVGQTPEVLAQGLYHIASAGAPAKQWMDMLAASAHLTGIGLGNMEDSSQAIIGVMAAMFPDIKSANDAMAILNTTAGIGDMRLSDLATSIGTGVLSSFKTAGLEMKDFSAGMATLTDNVTPPQVAATRLRMAIALLSGPSGVAVKALSAVGLSASAANKAFKDEKYLAQFGVNMTQLSADLHKPNGLLTAIMDLKTHLKASGLTATEQSAVITRAFGGARTAAGIELLLNESDRLNNKYKQLGSTSERAKKAQEAWANQQKTFAQQVKDARASVEAMAIKLGNMLLPALTKIFGFINAHQSAMYTFFGTMLTFLALLTAAWIAEGIAMIAANWELILIIAVIAAISYGIFELVKHWKTVWNWIKEIAKDVWDWLKSAWAATWKFIKGVALDVWHWLVDQWNAIIGAIRATVAWVKKYIVDPIVHLFTKLLVDPIIFYFHILMDVWNLTWKIISGILKFAWGFISTVLGTMYHRFMSVLVPMFRAFAAAWKIMWGYISTGLKFIWTSVLKPVLTAIGDFFVYEWRHMVAAVQWAWGLLKALAKLIVKYVIDPIVAGAKFLAHIWNDDVWPALVRAVKAAWGFLKMIWGYIWRDGIAKIIDAVNFLKKIWDSVWGGITKVTSSVWDKLKPIFDKIIGAFDKVKKGTEFIMNSPGKAGSALAHLIGFDKGGRVPGAPGTPHIAVVHGGEYVLSNDMQAGRSPMTGLGTVFSGGQSMGVAIANASRNSGVDHITVVADGKALFDFYVQRAQRNKNRNTSTFLT